MGKVKINNMKFYTYNGVLKEERVLGQPLEIDVEIKLPLEELNLEDDINNTVSYADVYEIVKGIVTKKNFDLIESLGNEIRREIKQTYKEKINGVIVRVRKYSVPINGIFDNVEIEVGDE